MRALSTALFGALLAAASPAEAVHNPLPDAADERDGRRFPAQTADFWREVKNPDYARSRTHLRQGMHWLMQVLKSLDEDHGRRVRVEKARNAIIRFELAHRKAPQDPEALYILAKARQLARGLWMEATAGGEIRDRP